MGSGGTGRLAGRAHRRLCPAFHLDACARDLGIGALYTLVGGAFVSYILGAPEVADASFRELFADGLPPVTPLVAKGELPSAVDERRGDAGANYVRD